MATESLYWASGQTFTLTNGTGAGTDIDDDPDSPDANWVTGSSNAIDLLVGFTTPSGPPTTGSNAQQFRAWIRQASNGPNPDWAMDVYENGTLRQSAIATGTISNGTGGELVTGNWTYSGFSNSDGSGVEIKIRQTAGSRDIDVGAVEWVADYVITKSGTDTLAPSITETSSLAITVFKSAADSINPRVDDPSPINFLTSSRADDIRPRIDDVVSLFKQIGLQDSILPRLDDPTPGNVLALSRAEDIRVRIDDVSDLLALFAVSDTLRPAISDSLIFTLSILSVTPDPFDDQMTGVTIAGSGFGTSQGTGKVEVSDSALYGQGTVVEQTVTSWGNAEIQFTGVIGALNPSPTLYLWVTRDDTVYESIVVGMHRAQAFALADSTNIVASGENTTAQLDPPSGKSTGDFGGGRIQDDENPGDAVDVGRNQYREDEWALIALDGATLGQQYQFRVVVTGVASTTPLTEVFLPAWTVQSPAIPKSASDTLYVKIDDLVAAIASASTRTDNLTLSITEAVALFSALSRSENLLIRIDEAYQILSSLSRADTLSVRLDYAVALFVTLARADTLSPQLIDDLNTILAFSSRSDTLYPRIDDASNIVEVFSKLALSDTLLPRIDDIMGILSRLDVSDNVLPMIDDTASIIAVLIKFALSDDLKPTLNEAIAIASAFIRSDTLSVTIDDIFDILSFIVGRYRWRSDDGSESTATWLDSENTDVTREININTRLRIQVDTDGDTGVTQFVLQYRKVGDPDWEWRDVVI